MAIHVYNISAMFLRAESPGGLIHTTASELHIDGSVVQNARTLLVNINLSETSTKILRHSDKQLNENTCLGELSFAISLEANLVAQGNLSFEVIWEAFQSYETDFFWLNLIAGFNDCDVAN